MKLSDYIAEYLSGLGIRHVFAISGGASLHLIHSIEKTAGIDFICPQHEQAGAMAADGYARVTGKLGAAIATSGPGATNLITGICCAYYDSVPVIYITGQVATFRSKGDSGVRQVGFQETDIVDICNQITKYSVIINEAKNIRYELDKAVYLARAGRPGPVLLDIPDNIQRADIDPKKLKAFPIPKKNRSAGSLKKQSIKCLEMVKLAKRPVMILGWGIRLAGAEEEVKKLISKLGIPVAPTWAVADIMPSDDPLYIGTFGTHGTRHANFAVQNADLILSIGSRLDTKATGSPANTFARSAMKIVVDIDPHELSKFKKYCLDVDLAINADAKDFVKELNARLKEKVYSGFSDWLAKIADWKIKYPVCVPKDHEKMTIDPYTYVKTLSGLLEEGETIFVDTGCTLAWMMQAFSFKAGQRLYHDWNNTAMGWALPASIGASFALGKKRVLCVTGDGSLQMNIQELATVAKHNLPIKIFLVNNHGYSMIQQTQDQWLGSKYLASTVEGGLAFPDFIKVAEAYGLKTVNVRKSGQLTEGLKETLDYNGPVLCNIEISSAERVIPQVKYGRPNEDPDPLLERNEFIKNMIVKPLTISLGEVS